MQQPEKKHQKLDDTWLAYGPEKQEWKEAGNYYSTDDLERLEKSLHDLKIRPASSVRIHVE